MEVVLRLLRGEAVTGPRPESADTCRLSGRLYEAAMEASPLGGAADPHRACSLLHPLGHGHGRPVRPTGRSDRC